MTPEIERKFLVNSKRFKDEAFRDFKIVQGFLSKDPKRTIRIRLKDNKAFLTIKGISSTDGLTRLEWEKEISPTEGKDLLSLCDDNLIEKTRYLVKQNHHTFEVDVFEGRLHGLIIAEIELESENEYFEKPEWLGKEVTGNPKYYNSNL